MLADKDTVSESFILTEIRGLNWSRGYKTFHAPQLSMKFIQKIIMMPINVQMLTIVGILTFISMVNTSSESFKALRVCF